MSRYRVYLDSFSTGLEDLNRCQFAKHRPSAPVLGRGRFAPLAPTEAP